MVGMTRRVPAVALSLALALTAVACGGDDDDDGASGSSSSAVVGNTSSAPPDGSSDTTVGVPDTLVGGTDTTAGGAATTRRGSTATTSPPATPAPTAAPGVAPPAPAAAGTYRYRQSGSAKVGNGQPSPAPGEGTLKVDAADGAGNQVFHRYLDPNGQPSDTFLAFRPDGVFLTKQILRLAAAGQNFEFTCTFNPPVASPPWPPAVGATFSGKGECGRFTADVSGRISGTRAVQLDGATIETFVIETTVTTSGQLTSTSRLVDWYSKAHRLQVHTESHQEGTYGPFRFTSDLTADLISGRPS
jgi:hypothetical protein